MQKKMLLTGFDPFGGETINPSWEAVARLPDHIGPWQICKLQVPTIFEKAAAVTLEAAAQMHPDAIVCIGQAGGRKGITPEMVAINLRHAAIPDNAGNMPQDERIVPGGPDAYFSTLPVRVITKDLQEAGIPSAVSYSAGAFVCNDLMYSLLHQFSASSIPVGFIHVPYLPQQAGENVPCMLLEDMIRGLEIAIQAMK